jgi:hypothetical protein
MTLTASAGLLEMFGKLTSGAGVGVGSTIVVNPSGAASDATGPATQIEVFSDGALPDGGFQQWSAQGIWLGFATAGVLSTSAGFMQILDTEARIGAGDISTSAAQATFGTDGTVTIDSVSGGQIKMASDGSVRLSSPNNNFIQTTASGLGMLQNGSPITVKSFVIDHPEDDPADPRRWLVHACTESPTAGIEYTGEAETVDGWAEVTLPAYFEALCLPQGRTVHLTAVDELCLVAATPIEGGRFGIRCSGPTGTKVSWLVKATRKNTGFDPEPLRTDYIAHGDGPYRYLTPRPQTVKDAA